MGIETISKFAYFRRFLSISLFIVIAVLILFSAAIESYQTKSIEPLVKKVGNSFILVTNQLREHSQAILDLNSNFNMYKDYKLFFNLFIDLFIIYHWIRLFSWIVANSPFSNSTQSFTNFFIGIIVFTLFQMFTILITAGIDNEITSFSTATDLVITPFICYWIFIQAIMSLVIPLNNSLNQLEINKTIPLK
jgi:hypothetical protein